MVLKMGDIIYLPKTVMKIPSGVYLVYDIDDDKLASHTIIGLFDEWFTASLSVLDAAEVITYDSETGCAWDDFQTASIAIIRIKAALNNRQLTGAR